jgi:hypothetical protein
MESVSTTHGIICGRIYKANIRVPLIERAENGQGSLKSTISITSRKSIPIVVGVFVVQLIIQSLVVINPASAVIFLITNFICEPTI